MNLPRVHVDLSARGAWEVVMPEHVDRLGCRTLEEARRTAHRLATSMRPCELVVQDAYHRVVEHELIQRGGDTLTMLRSTVARSGPDPAGAESDDEWAARGNTASSGQPRVEELPLADYDSLNAVAITKQLPRLSAAQLSAVGGYEQSHRNRKTVCARIAALQSGQTRTRTVA